MKIAQYIFEVTTLQPELRLERRVFTDLPQAVAALAELPSRNAVILVAALGKNVDYGNFILFLNGEGAAYVMIHEHREFFATDPSRQAMSGNVMFLDEDGGAFNVDAALTTSEEKGKSALMHWLPNQEQ